MTESSAEFYALLHVQDAFTSIADLSNFTAMPDDWCVIIADVMNSTTAIRDGEYKAVNITGVSVITSVLNVTRPLDVPYIFGGDGATLCIPGSLEAPVREALIATRSMTQRQFGLILRIGMVPVSAIRSAGFTTLVARHRISAYFIQAAFAGGGIEYAERIIKNDSVISPFRIHEHDKSFLADYSGLECRWDNIPSKHGETIALIVKAVAGSLEQETDIYSEIISKIQKIYGDDELSRPMYKDGLHTTLNSEKLKYEFMTRTCNKGKFGRIKYWLSMRLQILLGRVLMKYGINAGDVDWSMYQDDLVRNTDFRKFDGTLREVLSGTSEQRRLLTQYLEDRYKKGECVYGLHVSNAALITCLIHNRSGSHYHFVDGADGGYAMAASHMKDQIKTLS
ncbi:MAG: hypothetical protein A3G96_02320 [Gammaproteobacteria bacterium RIFCSPLOWO2_12_FULL_52_10]|nr:MAG: hypothetical protein A3G96_02320 [Gammaproteobacteria bacterium RIFCSPLOWO2_12_FULL_52_10]